MINSGTERMSRKALVLRPGQVLNFQPFIQARWPVGLRSPSNPSVMLTNVSNPDLARNWQAISDRTAERQSR